MISLIVGTIPSWINLLLLLTWAFVVNAIWTLSIHDWNDWFNNLSASSITRYLKCCNVKFGVEFKWSINLPGVAINISTFDEPPSRLCRGSDVNKNEC